ncbi:ATP-binding protein [Sulfurimicrobium lacus]|nr:ATP-binding protein [Sulfurimicrobium lacus]
MAARLALVFLAYAASYYHLHLFIGASFAFGSIVTLLALRLFGMGWAVAAAAAGFLAFESAPSFTIALMLLEPVVVGLALRGKGRNLALIDGAFWLALGMPLLWGAAVWLHHSDFSGASYYAMIQGFNGIFNALVASLILDFLPLRRWVGMTDITERIPLYRIATNLLASVLIFCVFLIILLNREDEMKRLESTIRHHLDDISKDIGGDVSEWREQRVRLAHFIAISAETLSSPQLQRMLDRSMSLEGDVAAMQVSNDDGVVLARAPHGAGRGEGLFGQLGVHAPRSILQPDFSPVFMDKASHQPMLGISVALKTAATSGGSEQDGHVTVVARMTEIIKLLETHAHASGVEITLLSRERRVIATTRNKLLPMEIMPPVHDYFAPLFGAWFVRSADESMTFVQERNAHLTKEMKVGPEAGWTLYIEMPAFPHYQALQQRLINNMAMMWVGIMLAFLFGAMFSRRMVVPLEKLAEATANIKARLLGDEEIRLDSSPIQEIDALLQNFHAMALELNRSYTELGRSNETLEQIVAARTEELTHANQKLKQHLTEREQFEVALARHAHDLEQTTAELISQKFALDQHSIVAIADPQGNITYANDKFCEISQYGREELLGQNHRILNSGFHDRTFFQEMWTTIVSGKVWHGEVCNRKKGGDIYWVATTIVPFMDALGSPYQYVSIRTDITARKQTETELMRAKDAAETANRAKSEFLSRMSHELRTPLNAILGFGQLLESDVEEPLTISQLENVEQITKAGWHLLELVNEVLDLSRIEAGKMQMQMADLLLAEVVRECIGLFMPLAAERHIQVNDEITPCIAHHVRADHTRLKQVILNYLSNAVKYNREGGEIYLKCEQMPGGVLRVSVSDTGPGIPESKLAELFQPFNRLEADGTDVQGTGVGLAVVKRLAELMGGSVGVISEVGQGTTFWLDIPEVFPGNDEISHSQMAGEGGDEIDSGDTTQTHRVLYVEEGRANAELVNGFIRSHRPELLLTCTTSAEQALGMALSESPDLILMDLNLPGLDGFDALELMREFDSLRDVPVIAMGADASAEQVEKSLKAGFCNYLAKPLNQDQFLAAVDLALDTKNERLEVM